MQIKATRLIVAGISASIFILAGCSNKTAPSAPTVSSPVAVEATVLPDLKTNLGKPTRAATSYSVVSSDPEQIHIGLTYSVGGQSIRSRDWIFAHANSFVEFDLPQGKFTKLTFFTGLDDCNGADPGSVVYIVNGDGRELYRSPVVRAMEPPKQASVDITGVKHLQLQVNDGGNGITDDEAYWIDVQGK